MERCFSCAEIGKCTELYARKPFDYRGPYFPIFERFNPPSSSNSISPDGTVKVCELCHIFLLSQWQNYERQGVLESRRIYFTKRHDGVMYNNTEHYLSSNSDINFGSKSNYALLKNGDQRSDSINSSNKTPISLVGNINSKSCLGDVQGDKSDVVYDSSIDLNNKQLTEHHICCFVCGLPCLKWHAKTAYSSQVLENKEYFPFFEKLDPPQLSIGLTNGATKICIQCESDLQKQWEHYESLGTDQMRRTYHITNEHNNIFSITNPGRFITNSMVSNPLFSVIKIKNSTTKCALCPNKVIDPYSVSWNQRASCLFILNLKNFSFPNEGVMVDKQSEEAIICDVCHYFLSYQMQAYNTNMTPLHLREYKLPKVGSLSPAIPSSNDKQASNNRKPVTLGSSLSAFSAPEGWQQSNSQVKRSKTPTLKCRSKTPVQCSDNNRINPSLKPVTGCQDQTNVLGPIIANCHICLQELRDPNTLKILPSVVNEDNPDQPYFPLLKTLRMNSIKNYEFPVCLHCFHNLHGQWRMFHKAAVPIYERKYNHNEFMCTLCQHLFAQKSDIVIVHDRLLCVSCSDKRACEVSKSAVAYVNQDTDATSHNSLFSMKAKTTVTVTPISNELSGPNLASLNYGETIKQLNAKLFESTVPPKPISTSTPVPTNNSMNQYHDISRNPPSLSSDMYQNSKNLFSKSLKKPAVAAVAPNQRQNTPQETLAAHSDLRIKIPESYHNNIFNQNSAFNPFSGTNNYPSPMFSANSAFALHSPHTPGGRKSNKPERDNFLQLPGSIHNSYFDHKSRINTPLAPTNPNPFINWTQHHPQHEAIPVTFPMQQLPNVFEQPSFPTSANNTNKEAEMTMLLYMMYQKQMQMASDPSNKLANSWLNNGPSLEEMTMNYYQSMMSQHTNPAMFPTDDLLSGPSNNSTNNGGLQSYMMNAAMANYQYNHMLQMLTAYQQHASAPSLNNKPQTNIPSCFNQITMSEQMSKRVRPDIMMYEQPGHNKSLTPNGFNDMLKYSEFLKSSLISEHEKSMTTKYPSMNMNTSIQTNNIDNRLAHNQKLLEHMEAFGDKLKVPKQSREDNSFSDTKKNLEAYGKSSVVQALNHHESKVRRYSKTNHEAGVLDLSQSKPTHKSSYAIDSLTEFNKSCDADSNLDNSCCSSASLTNTNDVKVPEDVCLSVGDFEKPLNMSYSREPDVESSIPQSQSKRDHLVKFLRDNNTLNLIDVLKATPIISDTYKSSKSTAPTFKKCPTILKFHKFLNGLTQLYLDSDDHIFTHTRRKTAFMKEFGLERTLPSKNDRNISKIESYLKKSEGKYPQKKTTASEVYWTKWILKNLQHRLSIKMKPHLRRSLMRPVLSGDIEVRLCTAKRKHELETLRNIVKILIRFT